MCVCVGVCARAHARMSVPVNVMHHLVHNR